MAAVPGILRDGAPPSVERFRDLLAEAGVDVDAAPRILHELDEALRAAIRQVAKADPALFRGVSLADHERAEDKLDEILQRLSRPEPVSCGGCHGVPALPEHHVPRTSGLESAKRALCVENAMAVAAVAARPVGVQGMGGIGKSVLAAEVAWDSEIRARFPHGILWISLGQQPAIVLRQLDVARMLGDMQAAFEDAQAGRTYLEGLLAEKGCLLILDDVWDPRHVHDLLIIGPQCRMLITTRDERVVRALGATAVRLDVLPERQSLALLADWAGTPVDALPPGARFVAKECGHLPLALASIGAMVRHRPDSWDNALHRLQSADLAKIEAEFPDYPHHDLLRAIEVSVDALEPGDRTRYLDFAVFPEDTLVPPAVLQNLWASDTWDAYDTDDLLQRLADRSLARRDAEGRLVLHDLQGDYVRKRAGDLAELHNRLLDAYASRCLDGWCTGPDDGYFLQHLPWHLAQAGRREELRALLQDFHWLQAKLDATDPSALISDYDLVAWDDELRLVQGAIRLSAHVVASEKAQLAGQLAGRLLGSREPRIHALVERLLERRAAAELWPLSPCLTPPGAGLLLTLVGHRGAVLAVAVTPDGQRAISASQDKTLRVWDLRSGAELCTLGGHTDRVGSVSVTPDGQRAVSASDDGTLRVWNLRSGHELLTLEGHSDRVTAASITPDGQRVVSASKDRTLKVWDLQTGDELLTLSGHSGAVTSVLVTPDGQRVVSASRDRTLKVWELLTGDQVRTLRGHRSGVRGAVIALDGQCVVSASYDQTLKVWDLRTGDALRSLPGHRGSICAVAVAPDGRRTISASSDQTLKVCDVGTGSEPCPRLRGHRGAVRAVAVTPDGLTAVSASSDRTLRAWDLTTGALLRTFGGHTDRVVAVALTPDGQRAISASIDRTLRVWEVSPRAKLRASSGHGCVVHAIAVTPDGQQAISAADDQTLRVWDVATGMEVNTLGGHSHRVAAVVVTPDGRYAISASGDRTLRVWEIATGTVFRTLRGHVGGVCAVTVTPDGRTAVSGSSDRTVRVWDVATGAELRTLRGHRGAVYAVATTPDGRQAVSVSSDQTLRVWDLATGAAIRVIRLHGGGVCCVAVQPDGCQAICVSSDRSLSAWDLATGVVLRTVRWRGGAVNAAAVSADGRHALTASDDQTLSMRGLEDGRILCAFTGDAAMRACAVAADGRTIVAGDAEGRVYLLRLVMPD